MSHWGLQRRIWKIPSRISAYFIHLFIHSINIYYHLLSINIYPTPGGNRAYTIVGRQKVSK